MSTTTSRDGQGTSLLRERRVLVVDDDPHIRRYLRELLTANGYVVDEVPDGEAAFQALEAEPWDVVLTDLLLPGASGLDVLRAARARLDPPEVLVITAHATIDSAVEAVRSGAFDYVPKPLNSRKLVITIERAAERRALRREVDSLRRQVDGRDAVDVIVASSPAMRRIFALVDIVSRTDSSVLVEGESGTGKELVARAIHYRGVRAARPFVALNCAALPGELLESELFGHARGAFTGAVADKKGLFEAADEGTLLLDEIGDMPLMLQAKLLRVLQNGEIRKVGSTTTVRVNVRIIAATHRDIAEQVRLAAFREDLYYRLNVIPIRIPPLRERRDDLVPLANHFIAVQSQRLGKDVYGITPDALDLLMSHAWPGNIRELENVIERAVTLCNGATITACDLAFIPYPADRPDPGLADGLPAAERRDPITRQAISRALEANDWNRAAAARALGIGRNTLWRKMKKLNFDPPG